MRPLFLGWALVTATVALPFMGWAVWGLCNGAQMKTAAGTATIVGFPSGTLCALSAWLAWVAVAERAVSRFRAWACFASAVLALVPVATFWVGILLRR